MKFLKKLALLGLVMSPFIVSCSSEKKQEKEQASTETKLEEATIGNCNIHSKDLSIAKRAFKKSFWFPDYYEDSVKVRIEYVQINAPKKCATIDSLNRFLKGYPENVFKSEVGLREGAEDADVEDVPGNTEITADYYVFKGQILSLVYKGDNGYSEGWALGDNNFRLSDGKSLMFNEVFYPDFKSKLLEKGVSSILKKAEGQKHDFLVPLNREVISYDIEDAIKDSNFFFTKEGLEFIIKSKYASALNKEHESYFLIHFANSEIESFLNKRNLKIN